MSLTTYLKTTKHLFASLVSVFKPLPPIETQIDVLEKMGEAEGDKLYVENVRAFFGVTKEDAALLCEQGVQEGFFQRHWALLCGNTNCRRVILESVDLNTLTGEVSCENCSDLEEDISTFEVNSLDKLLFYTSRTHGK